MPTVWLRFRSALVVALFFPWFPVFPSSPPEAPPPALAAEAGAADEPKTGAPAEEPLVLPGVVIEEMPKGSALEKAGLQVGDVILTWERLPNPPANPEGAEGVLTSYFDWQALEEEQVPRGVVVLRGRRAGELLELRVEPGLWAATVRPVLSRALEKIYLAGKAQLASGDIEAAVGAWRSLEEGVGGERGGNLRAWVVLRIGNARGEKVEWGKAVETYREALKVTDSPSVQVAAWEALGEAHEERSEYEAAEKAYASALVIRQGFYPEGLGVASTLNKLGEVQSLAMASNLGNLGVVAWNRGELERTYDYHLQALQIREKLAPQSLVVATSLNNLAAVVWSRGEFDHAHDYLRRSLTITEQLAPESLKLATCLDNLGNLAQARGELGRAEDYCQRALQIREQLAPHSFGVAGSLDNLGVLAWSRGDLDRAHTYFRRALKIKEQLAPESLTVAQSLSNLGAVAQARGEQAAAQAYALQSLRLKLQFAPQSLTVATSLNLLGLLAWTRGELAASHAYFSSALQIREQLAPQSLDVATTLDHLAAVARARGQLGPARAYYSRALNALEHQVSRLGGSYSVRAGFRAQHAEYYHDLLDLLFAQGSFPEALLVLERFRAQTFLTMLAERDTAFTADIPEELDRERRRLGVQYDRTLKRLAGLNPRDNSEEIEASRREIQKLDDEAGDVEARIRQASPRLAALKYPHPLDAAEAQQALDTGTLLLSYSVGKEKTALFTLSRSGDLEVKILPLGEEALRSQVKQLLSLIREAAQGSSLGALRQQRLQAASQELYAGLLGPVAKRIAASERLLILPDGPLHALPFTALVRDAGADGAAGNVQYLAEWKPLHVALSATVFAELKQRRHTASENFSQAPIQIAAFGDPVYPQSLTKPKGVAVASLPMAARVTAQVDVPRGDPVVRSAAERGIFDWPPLPYTRHEVEGIASLFPAGTARTFLGPEALEERIKSLDPKTRILHLAAHGYTDEHLPSSSFVALTIPEDTNPDANGPERDNGLLQVWEIFEKVRLDADLVVLSACDTALGEEEGGEGLIGLTRAFQYAGARTVMASLWSVQDQATSELMIRFYKHLRAGLPKDEALRQAQIELIRGPIEVVDEKGEKTLLDASAPYFWAGFQLYGDWQ